LEKIQMLNLQSQYQRLKPEIDQTVLKELEMGRFINGDSVTSFENILAQRLDVAFVIGCGNGTDALQIALMALDLEPNAEVILPAFTYPATAEVVALLGYVPVYVDVESTDFNIDVAKIEEAITSKTKVIMPVHLFGQAADMSSIMELAQKHKLYVIEDNAQAIDAEHISEDGSKSKLGTLGDIGITSFFPTKNLGCYGDGGALFTKNELLAKRIRKIANHGQSSKYYHDIIGVNSRLDSLQAAILKIKLNYLDQFNKAKQDIAHVYNRGLKNIEGLKLPFQNPFSTHVYHQYTLQIEEDRRDSLKDHLAQNGIQSTIYYPIPIHVQEAYKKWYKGQDLSNAESLSNKVLSIPIHTEMSENDVQRVISVIKEFFA
jgi:UDP-2-acetamido-2-deoxy-ribo-hexuluronate aminotransferase